MFDGICSENLQDAEINTKDPTEETRSGPSNYSSCNYESRVSIFSITVVRVLVSFS